MTDETKPGRFSENDRIERNTIRVIYKCLNYDQVWFSVESMDKYPNQDGFVEILDKNGVPLGELIVQIKRIPDRNTGSPKKPVKTSTLSYGYSTNAPFILLGVDLINELVYWKHLSEEWLDQVDLDGAERRTVHFPSGNVITGNDVFELSELKSLAESESEYLSKLEVEEELKHIIKIIHQLTDGSPFDGADLRAHIADTEIEYNSGIGITPGVLRLLAENTEYISEHTSVDGSVAIVDKKAKEDELSSAHINNTKQVRKIVFRAVSRDGHSQLTEFPIDWNSPEHIDTALKSVGVRSVEFVLNKHSYKLTSDGVDFAESQMQ